MYDIIVSLIALAIIGVPFIIVDVIVYVITHKEEKKAKDERRKLHKAQAERDMKKLNSVYQDLMLKQIWGQQNVKRM